MEAEGWYKRALALIEQTQPNSAWSLPIYNGLAKLLLEEVQADRTSLERLTEAHNYAKQALTIQEALDTPLQIWQTLNTLAAIADLTGRAEEARNYRRRERETYVAFAGHRYQIDYQYKQLIATIAAATQDDKALQEAIEAAFPEHETRSRQMAEAMKRLWAGERDWNILVEDLDTQSALLILRVLETIVDLEATPAQSAAELFASLPTSVRDALQQGDQPVFAQALAELTPEEQQRVVVVIQTLQGLVKDGEPRQDE